MKRPGNTAIYTRDGCPYCTKIKEVYKSKGWVYAEYKLNTNFTREQFYNEFGDTELIGYVGGGKSLTDSVGVYGEISAATAEDDVNWAGKAGLKYTF